MLLVAGKSHPRDPGPPLSQKRDGSTWPRRSWFLPDVRGISPVCAIASRMKRLAGTPPFIVTRAVQAAHLPASAIAGPACSAHALAAIRRSGAFRSHVVGGIELGDILLQEEVLEGECLDEIDDLAILAPGEAAAQLRVVECFVGGEILVHDAEADIGA